MAVTTSYSFINVKPEFTDFYSAIPARPSSDERNPALVRLADGGFAVVFEYASLANTFDDSVVLNRYDATGTVTDGFISPDTFVSGIVIQDPDITRLSNGNLLMVWTEVLDGIHYAIVNPTTSAIVQADTLAQGTFSADFAPEVVALSNGGFAFVKQQSTTGGLEQDADLLFYDNAGMLVSFVALGNNSARDERDPVVAVLSNGNVVVAYEKEKVANSDTFDVAYQIFTAAGAPVLAESFAATAGDQNIQPDILALSSGGFVIAYAENPLGVAALSLAFYNADGSLRGRVRADTNFINDRQPSLTELSNGFVSVAWTYETAGDFDIQTALIDPVTLSRVSTGVTLIESQTGFQSQPSQLALGNGQVVTAWTDDNNAITDGNVDPNGSHIALQIDQWRRTSIGDAAANTINGDDLVDIMAGSGGSDQLSGAGGNDVLDGGTGADGMNGGDGDDIYDVDNAGDTVTETNAVVATGGYDVVIASVNHTLSVNVEQLALQGGATIGTGNNTDNYLYGGNSGLSLTLNGMGGDDVLFAGLAGSNTMNGGAGVDTLLMYGGNNVANGGLDSDIYYTYTSTDTISEAGGDGIDTVYATYSIAVGEDIEQVLISGAATSITSTSVDDNNIFYGNSATGPVTLNGGGGADVLFGGLGGDTLNGGAGVDLLFGNGGADMLAGGADTDVYYLTSGSETVSELGGGGFDTAYSNAAAPTTLAANVEQLILYGAATGATGNNQDNYLYGHIAVGAVTLDGAGGNDYLLDNVNGGDVLIGGAGNDIIDLRNGGMDLIRYAAAGSGADTVIGFNATVAGQKDLIDVSGRGFSAASIGGAIVIAAAGADTLVTIGSDSIRLVGVAPAAVTDGDFIF